MTSKQDSREAVLLLHGLGGIGPIMWPLARRLRLAGYQANIWPYASTRRTVSAHADLVLPVLRKLDESTSLDRVHFVTHSMGGIVLRVALQRQPITKSGRFVMIAPPNRGTPLATKFSWLPGWILRPRAELTDEPHSFVNLLQPPSGLQTGIIAASHDMIVPTSCTYLQGQCDHIVVRGLHTQILFRRKTAEQVLAFLRDGRFMHC